MNDRPNYPDTTAALRWLHHDPGFASLMLGRIELAQISQGWQGDWWLTLRFCRDGELASFSAPTEQKAKAAAEEHARKVLA